jgi:thiamine biosynthesis lipoprotein
MTVGPLVELWRNSLKEKRLPTGQEIASAKELVGFDKVTLDPENRSVRFAKPGMRLTTGGIGKGMAVDKARKTLEFYGITRAIFHGGTSSILAIGTPPGEDGWKVLVQNPYNSEGAIAEVTLRDETMSCSGHVVDTTEIDGKKYGHILNPATGMPVQGMLITMAIGPSGTDTDALTKVFFVNGERAAEEYCSRHPEVRAIVVPDTGTKEPVPKRFNFGK